MPIVRFRIRRGGELCAGLIKICNRKGEVLNLRRCNRNIGLRVPLVVLVAQACARVGRKGCSVRQILLVVLNIERERLCLVAELVRNIPCHSLVASRRRDHGVGRVRFICKVRKASAHRIGERYVMCLILDVGRNIGKDLRNCVLVRSGVDKACVRAGNRVHERVNLVVPLGNAISDGVAGDTVRGFRGICLGSCRGISVLLSVLYLIIIERIAGRVEQPAKPIVDMIGSFLGISKVKLRPDSPVFICKPIVRRAVCQNDHELVRVFVALLEALACAVNTGLNVRAVPVFAPQTIMVRIPLTVIINVVRVDGVDIILNCCQLAAEVPVVDGLRCVGYNRDAHIRIAGQNLLRKSLRRLLCVLQPVSLASVIILRHAQGAVDHEDDVGLFRRLRGLFAGYLDGNLCNTGFFIHPLRRFFQLRSGRIFARLCADPSLRCRRFRISSDRRNRHNADEHQHRKYDAQKAFFHVLLSPCVKFSYVL